MHGVLLLPALDRPHEDEGLGPLRPGTTLGLHVLPHRLPVLRVGDLARPFAQLALRRADQVAPPRLAQPGEVLRAGHAPIHDPDPLGLPIAGLHRPHDLLHRGHVGPVAGEQLVAQRHALTGDDQGQADLAAVGPMIAAVPALGERVTRRGAFEVRARYVVEEQIVVQGEQLPQPLDQVLFQRRLVGKEAIQRPIAPIVVDQGGGQREQVLKRGAPVPIFRDVQLARGLAQPGEDKDGRHGRPGHVGAARGQQPLQQRVQLQGAPQRPAEPDIAKAAPAFQAEAIQPDWNRRRVRGERFKQLRLLPSPGDRAGQGAGVRPALRVQLAEMRHRLLPDLPSDPHRAHQPPVGVRLAVLHARRVAQVHYSAYPPSRAAKSMNLVGTTS